MTCGFNSRISLECAHFPPCPSSTTLACTAFLSHLDDISSLLTGIRYFWPLASASQPLSFHLWSEWTVPVRCDSLPSDIVWSQVCTIAVFPVGPRTPLMSQGGRGGCCVHAQLGSVGTLAPLMDGVPASDLRWVSNSGRPCAQEVPTEWSPCGREQCPNKPSPASFLVHPSLLFPEITPQKLPAPKSLSWLCLRGIPS